MKNLDKLNYEIIGMMETFKKKPDAKLCNRITGLKFKYLRLFQGITAEAVVSNASVADAFDVPPEIFSPSVK